LKNPNFSFRKKSNVTSERNLGGVGVGGERQIRLAACGIKPEAEAVGLREQSLAG